jgi:hypothetical protein
LRLKFMSHSVKLRPQAAARTREARALAGGGNILTRESATEQPYRLNCSTLDSDFSDILIPPNIRPVFREHSTAVFVFLDLPQDRTEPGPLQAEF